MTQNDCILQKINDGIEDSLRDIRKRNRGFLSKTRPEFSISRALVEDLIVYQIVLLDELIEKYHDN